MVISTACWLPNQEAGPQWTDNLKASISCNLGIIRSRGSQGPRTSFWTVDPNTSSSVVSAQSMFRKHFWFHFVCCLISFHGHSLQTGHHRESDSDHTDHSSACVCVCARASVEVCSRRLSRNIGTIDQYSGIARLQSVFSLLSLFSNLFVQPPFFISHCQTHTHTLTHAC